MRQAFDAAAFEMAMRDLGLDGLVDEPALRRFEVFAQYLAEANTRLNLTRIRGPEAVAVRHFADSMACSIALGDLEAEPRGDFDLLGSDLGLKNPRRLIDIGSGAGFPGMALKLAFPEWDVTLVESLRKKARFLEGSAALEALDLDVEGIEILAERAETLGQDPRYREVFDLVTARAVAPMRILAEYMLPLLRPGGLALALKGATAKDELEEARSALEVLGGDSGRCIPYSLPDVPGDRYLIAIEKLRATPEEYPRRPGRPSKNPL